MNKPRIKVLLVDNRPVARREALERLRRLAPDVIVVGVPSSPADSAPLTARERQVLALLADGLANKEVGRRLGISVRTAETHRGRLSQKLALSSVAGLTKYAIRQGLTTLT
ncbi:MAG: response regulator transcription factor [Elusimicrobia bacterium]|nr:response regulator transcription factor [Elusimicrobiota bacterium]